MKYYARCWKCERDEVCLSRCEAEYRFQFASTWRPPGKRDVQFNCPNCGAAGVARRQPVDTLVRCVPCARVVSDAMYRKVPYNNRPLPPLHPACDYIQRGTWPKRLQWLWWLLHRAKPN